MTNARLLPEAISMIEEGHTITLPLRGFSMRPFLEDGRDKALLGKAGQLKVGDVVLAEIRPKTYVLHRIIAINGEHITLLGDGNLPPEYCRCCNVHAIALGFFRKGRTHLDSVNNRKWRCYSRCWMALSPLRRYLLWLYRRYLQLSSWRKKTEGRRTEENTTKLNNNHHQ